MFDSWSPSRRLDRARHAPVILTISPFFFTDSLPDPPAGRAGPEETLRHPPGRAQGPAEGQGAGRRQGGEQQQQQQPGRPVPGDSQSQQASLPQRAAAVHAEAAAGQRTHPQVQYNPGETSESSGYWVCNASWERIESKMKSSLHSLPLNPMSL